MKQEYWDGMAKDFSEQVLEISDVDLNNVIPKTAKRLGGKNKNAVDFGCGAGALTRVIAPYFGSTLGVDFSKDLLDRADALTEGTNISYQFADLSVPRGKRFPCDVAFCANVLISDDGAVREGIARKIVRNVTRGGDAVFIVPALESAIRLYQVAFAGQVSDGYSKHEALAEINGWARKDIASLPEGIIKVGGTKTKHFMGDELIEFLLAWGLRDVSLERVFYPWSELLEDEPRGLKKSLPWDWMAVGTKG